MDLLNEWNDRLLNCYVKPTVKQDQLFLFCEELLKNSDRHIELPIGSKLERVKLGSPLIFGTPSYWIYQGHCHHTEFQNEYKKRVSKRSLREEVLFCMLGGFGIPAEVAIKYYLIIKEHKFIHAPSIKFDDIYSILKAPIELNERAIRYRFPKQKSLRISQALNLLGSIDLSGLSHYESRDILTKLPGVGLKTASWVIRNHFDSNDVAIIDIHLERAAKHAGFFKETWTPSKDYKKMETAFLSFSNIAKLKASVLDLLIWNQMRNFSSFKFQQ